MMLRMSMPTSAPLTGGNEAKAENLSLEQIWNQASALQHDVQAANEPPEALDRMRIDGMNKRLRALLTRIEMLGGKKYPFDEETRLLYDAVAPHNDAQHFQIILDQIEELLPGEGSLAARVEAFRGRFVIPTDKLDSVFSAAIAECRRRTLQIHQFASGRGVHG